MSIAGILGGWIALGFLIRLTSTWTSLALVLVAGIVGGILVFPLGFVWIGWRVIEETLTRR
jgi:hypothetical protein